jgi:hypothetical protein
VIPVGGRKNRTFFSYIPKVTDLDRYTELKATMKIVAHPKSKNPKKFGFRNKIGGGLSKCVIESDIYKLHIQIWNRNGRDYVNRVQMRLPGDPLFTHDEYPESLLEAHRLAEAQIEAADEARAASEVLARGNQSSSLSQKPSSSRLGRGNQSSSLSKKPSSRRLGGEIDNGQSNYAPQHLEMYDSHDNYPNRPGSSAQHKAQALAASEAENRNRPGSSAQHKAQALAASEAENRKAAAAAKFARIGALTLRKKN